MAKRPRYPYPVPELLAYLEAMHDLEQDEQLDYRLLARLLQVCHATVEHANQIWRTGRYITEDPEIVTCQAVQFGFKRLIPLLFGAMVGGWQELLAYIEHPERFPWYRPDTDWSRVPPLKEVHPEEDEVEGEDVDHEEGARTECRRAIPSSANLSS